ncbi:MAG: hypothetical protein NUW37_04440 [Planctomycetes bacterium]|nr:hypothetical protein [Planctomycetota bacterium]
MDASKVISAFVLILIVAFTILVIVFWSGILTIFPTGAPLGFIIFDGIEALIATLAFVGLLVAQVMRSGTLSLLQSSQPKAWGVIKSLGLTMMCDFVSGFFTLYYFVGIILLGIALALETAIPDVSGGLIFVTVILFLLLIIGMGARAVAIAIMSMDARGQLV